MATFTIELRDVLELETDIGLNEYPLFDESYRPALNKKIIDHFYTREIGTETISMFRLFMRRRMNEIMSIYNQHYIASRITIDPLKTIDIKNVGTVEAVNAATGHSTTASTSGAKSRAVASDHPQENLSGTGDYATSSNDAISDTTANGTSDDTNQTTQNATNNGSTTGVTGSQAALIFQLRTTFVNVDMMVIDELEDLFMQVWSNADDYYGRKGFGYFDNYAFGFPV